MQRKADSSMRKRLLLIAVVFGVLCFIVLAGKIFYLQVVKYEEYQQRAISQQTRDKVIPASRGTIYDRTMKPLAISADTEMVTIEASKIEDDSVIPVIAENLSAILELDYDEVLAKVEAKATYAVIKRSVEKDVADQVRAFCDEYDLNSVIYMVSDTTRYYPYGNFLSHTLGFVGTDNQGLYGLEARYDDELSGVDGRVIKAANSQGGEMPFDYEMYYEAQDGNSLILTVDEVIQHYLEKNLEMAYADNKVADHVTGIVMDVNTGAILAMANKPDFDLNSPFALTDEELQKQIAALAEKKKVEESQLTDDDRKQARSDALTSKWLNSAVTYAYYPGSTFKILTASMALEEKLVSVNSTFYCPGYKQVDTWKINCWKTAGHGSETLVDAIKNSCNPAFMEIGATLGKSNFYKYFKAFGLNEKTGIDLPGESNGNIWAYDDMSVVDLAVASFGQNFEITPLQLITAVSAVANGGYLVTPHVVDSIIDADGNTVWSSETNVVRQVISQETSELMCDILEQVVSSGTGKNAYVAGYRVAGKTGTTEKIAKQNQTGRDDLRVSSFIAFAPADDPQIAVLILLDEPTVQPVTGGITVAPVIKRIMEDVLPYLEIEPVYTEEEQQKLDTTVPAMVGMTAAQARSAAQSAGLSVRTVGEGDVVTAQVPAYSATVSRSSTVVLYLSGEAPEETVVVPDLTGLSVSQVRSQLSALGLYYRSSGTEYGSASLVARRQDVAADTEVAKGTVITVEFSDLSQRAE
ncbi:MAG: penicillin-binding transpeptidase domain-containing protein [Butyricicoccaceae bacterium]